jgi:hypothetical protein
MLKIFAILFLFFLSLPVLACWKIEGTLGIDGETFKFGQKIEHGKDYSIALGTFIMNLKMNEMKQKKINLSFTVQERKENKLVLITNGKEMINENKVKNIYAKGEPGQPHSIITIKITHL